jgi:phosphoribosyl 1,2-cyclic phosphodiesterase
MLEVFSLASGSSGNCYYVGSSEGAILVDAGIPAKTIIERLCAAGKRIEDIKGVFVSHEHTDHVLGVDPLARKFGIPIYGTAGTLQAMNLTVDDLFVLEGDKEISFGGFSILPFSKQHDALEPVSYHIKNSKSSAAIITDVGRCCPSVCRSIAQSDILVLESNYDAFMLANGPYPKELQERVRGGRGHISNYEAALALLEHATPRLRHVFLGHISEKNNTPEIALKTVKGLLAERGDLKMEIESLSQTVIGSIAHLD